MPTPRRSTARGRAPRGLAAALAACLLLVAFVTAAPAARTNDRPLPGRFVGEHAFDGSITLTFKRESPWGLYLAKVRFRGVQRCEDGTDVPLSINHTVTARTSAKVKRDGRFTLSSVPLRIQGRYAGAKRVRGKLTISTLACRTAGGFGAKRTR